MKRISLVLAVAALFMASGCQSTPPAPAVKLTFSGPMTVPENTEYVYTATKPATWTVTGGTIASGQNTAAVTVDWGAGAALGNITAADTNVTVSKSIDIVQVTIQPNPIGGAQVADGGIANYFQYAQTVAPGVQFSATVAAVGTGKNWQKQIEVGYVQVLRGASVWTASYGGPPSVLTPNYATPLPWHDVIDNMPAGTIWYADGKKGTYFNAANSPGPVIAINDSPKPGWWHQNKKSSGDLLLEASVKWEFDTYICVRTLDEPSVLTIRDSASWSMSANYQKNRNPEVMGTIALPNPPTMSPDFLGHRHPAPISGIVVNDALRALDFY